ncbi:MAG TPA: class I adenylate-forming enzyme family protein [Xanthobacteraceae bacterium]|nr:class I adenylate-forming enzyme family protein [Xanthobacteraceae bacterium]
MADVFGKHAPKIPYRPIADLLAGYARRDPAKPAIVDLDQHKSVGFGALERAVTDIAAALEQNGVRKGSRVLLLADETLEKLLIWLATWRLGAVVAPLNIELNTTFIAELAAAVSPAFTLVHKGLDGNALLAGKPFVRFGSYTAGPAEADPDDDFFRTMRRGVAPENLPERNEAADLACIFCTSGTTDRPKIVVYDHCAYWLNGLSTLECLGLTEHDRTLEYRSFGWNSAQVLSLMPFLETGLTLHMARRFSHGHFFEWIKTYGITFAAGVPTVLNMLLNKPLGTTAKDVPTLRLMTCSTAPLTREQWLRFEEMYGVKLLQMYGMSEAGWMCGNRHYSSKMGTVGLPALHQELEIVDQEGRPCPPNVEGEVTAGGPHCAVGYLRDDGTIEPIRGKRIKSGDLAIMDEDGFIRVSGRTKDLIIRGGVNIAPREIDEVLLKHPGVLDAAAVGVPDPIYGEEVVCYVVAKPGLGLSEAAVLEHCRASLPAPKVPKQVLIVAELPKSDRGKVLRDKLREDWNERMKLSA